MKFLKITDRDDNLFWALLIDNINDLNKFIEDKAKDLYNAYDEIKSINGGYKFAHSSYLGLAIGMTLERTPNRKNVVDDIIAYSDVFLSPYEKVFSKTGAIVIWKNTNKWEPCKYGGFMPYSAFEKHPMKLKILQTIERDDLIFPIINEKESKYTENDISIKKWEGGKHFYAKIGKHDVVDKDGNVKWNTKETAMAESKRYLEELNKDL